MYTLFLLSKVVLAPNTTASAPINVPSPGQILRKNRRPANTGGRNGTDFWNHVSLSLELRISHSTRFPSGSFINIVLSVNLKNIHQLEVDCKLQEYSITATIYEEVK